MIVKNISFLHKASLIKTKQAVEPYGTSIGKRALDHNTIKEIHTPQLLHPIYVYYSLALF